MVPELAQSTSTAQPTKETQASQLRNTVYDLLDRANRCEIKVRTATDRLGGTTPSTTDNGTGIPEPPDGFIPELVVRLNQLTHILAAIEDSAVRLGQLV